MRNWLDKIWARLIRLQKAQDEALSFSDERREQILRARAKQLAQPIERVEVEPRGEAAIQFRLGEERYALAMDSVREVAHMPALTRIPGVPSFFAGVCHHRGEILAVLDLHVLFQLGLEGVSERTRLLVLGRERAEVGVLADVVESQTQVFLHGLQDLSLPGGATRDYVRGVTPDATIVLDGAALLDDPHLYIEHTDDHDPRGI